jgi:hypothetical protein
MMTPRSCRAGHPGTGWAAGRPGAAASAGSRGGEEGQSRDGQGGHEASHHPGAPLLFAAGGSRRVIVNLPHLGLAGVDGAWLALAAAVGGGGPLLQERHGGLQLLRLCRLLLLLGRLAALLRLTRHHLQQERRRQGTLVRTRLDDPVSNTTGFQVGRSHPLRSPSRPQSPWGMGPQ